MRVYPIVNNIRPLAQNRSQVSPIPQHDLNKDVVSFKSLETLLVEKELMKKGMTCEFKDNEFVARCIKQTVDVFENLFGVFSLPKKVSFESFSGGYASYLYLDDTVRVNSKHGDGCFKNMDNLKKEMAKPQHFIRPDWFSTKHPSHIFVHEFSHRVHWNHLLDSNGWDKAEKVWLGLNGTTVPTAIGRLITKFKLSNYAVKSNDMCEFLAERMTQDICAGLTDNYWLKYKDIDVGYSDIFSRKWNYRYSSPQSYIDYFTQQVWNGNIEEANHAGIMAETYLTELEAERVAPIVQAIETKTEKIPLLSKVGRFFAEISECITDNLDERNRLTVNKNKLML